jgi:hypothetical protein
MNGATAAPGRVPDFDLELDAIVTAARTAKMGSDHQRAMARRLAEEGFAISVRLGQARDRCEAALSTAQRLAQESRDIRAAAVADDAWPRFFVVHGRVDGERVRALWSRGCLQASGALRTRGELLASMGETFCVERGEPVVSASLLDPLAAMLTLIRSCDHLDEASFGPLLHRRSIVRYRSS